MQRPASESGGAGAAPKPARPVLAVWLRSRRAAGVVAGVAAVAYAGVVVAAHGALPLAQECLVVFVAVFGLVHLVGWLHGALGRQRRGSPWKDPNTL
jgi:hypothetical protein